MPKQVKYGASVAEACREGGITEATSNKPRNKYSEPMPEMKRLKLLEQENSKSLRLVADLSLDKAALHDAIER